MANWTKDKAIDYIDNLLVMITPLKRVPRNSSEHIRWLTNTLSFLEEVFGTKSYYYINIKRLSWQFSGKAILSAWDYNDEMERLHQDAYVNQLDSAHGILLAAKDYLELNDIDDVYSNSDEANAAGDMMKVISLSENKLRKIIRQKPEKEKEVQDAFENLLIGADVPYKREAPHIEYSSKHYIPDFSFDHISLAVEIKLCKDDEKKLIQQLNDDILAYKTAFSNILFIVYDTGIIRDVDTFKGSFENTDNVIVHVTKH